MDHDNSKEKLIFQTSPTVEFGTNFFTNVPVVLQFDDTPLISIVKEPIIVGFTTELPIYHPDGTYLAKVRGNRVFPTEDGTKAGIEVRQPKGMTVITMGGKPLFEVHHQSGDAFRAEAELHAPGGYLVKYSANPHPTILKADGKSLQVGGITMMGNHFNGCKIGIWVRSDGSTALGCS